MNKSFAQHSELIKNKSAENGATLEKNTARADEGGMKKRSVSIAGHQTSVSLEEPFWDALRDLAAARGLSAAALIAEIDASRDGNLSSAIRVYVLNAYRGAPTEGAAR